ncbi:MAG: hypothetical protein KDB86_05980 [Actinobacteria bacterium]|nr:hypothetical protein [Actinomycetota bacterium]
MARLSKTPNARPAGDDQLPDGARPRRARDERAREIERLRAENIALREENHRLQMQVLGVYGAEDEASRLREIARVQTDAGDDVAALQAETVMLRRALSKVTEEAMVALGDLQERLRATPTKRAAAPRPTRAESNGSGPRSTADSIRPDLARPNSSAAPATRASVSATQSSRPGAAPAQTNGAFAPPAKPKPSAGPQPGPKQPSKGGPANQVPAQSPGSSSKIGGSSSPVVKPIGPVNGSQPVPGQGDLRAPRSSPNKSGDRPRPSDPRRTSSTRRG